MRNHWIIWRVFKEIKRNILRSKVEWTFKLITQFNRKSFDAAEEKLRFKHFWRQFRAIFKAKSCTISLISCHSLLWQYKLLRIQINFQDFKNFSLFHFKTFFFFFQFWVFSFEIFFCSLHFSICFLINFLTFFKKFTAFFSSPARNLSLHWSTFTWRMIALCRRRLALEKFCLLLFMSELFPRWWKRDRNESRSSRSRLGTKARWKAEIDSQKEMKFLARNFCEVKILFCLKRCR